MVEQHPDLGVEDVPAGDRPFGQRGDRVVRLVEVRRSELSRQLREPQPRSSASSSPLSDTEIGESFGPGESGMSAPTMVMLSR